jgi:hypothetical protein
MRLLYSTLLTIAFISCEHKKFDLDNVAKSLKEHYWGHVEVTFQEDIPNRGFILLDLKDTIANSHSNSRPEQATQLIKSAFYLMTDTQRSSVNSIKIKISNDKGTYLQDEILIKDLFKDDSLKQIEYCDILPDILLSEGLAIGLREISKAEFYRLAPKSLNKFGETKIYRHNDSLEYVLKSKFHDKFLFKEGCYSFNVGKEREINFCRRNDPNNDRSYEQYELINKYEEFFIFLVTVYEGWRYVIFDSNSGQTYSTSGYPNFSYSKKYIYSETDYYGEAIISIHRLTDNKEISFSFDNWDIVEDYWINEEGIRLKLTSTLCRQGGRYVDCHFTN